MDGLRTALPRLACRSDFSCCSSVVRKAAGLEKSRFLSVLRTNSVANFSALSCARSTRSSAYCRRAAWIGPLLVGVRNLDRLQHPLREPGRAVPLRRQLRLQAPHHDRVELLAVGRRAAGEPLVVEQFEQRREALRVAVVRRGGQEQLVLEVRHEQPERLGPQRVGGVPAHARRGAVVRLVHDQQVELAGVGRLVRPRQEFPEQPQRPLPLEEVDGGDEPGEVGPRVDVDAPAAAQHPHQRRVHDAEVEAELVPHLLPPLDLERGRADDQNLPGPVPDDEFQRHHARLDGLAEAHVVGDQQVDPRHLDRPHHRVELVVLDVDAARNGAWMFRTSADDAAPQRTASRKASSRSGASKPVGSGSDLLDDPGPGSSSQMTSVLRRGRRLRPTTA